MTTISVIGLGKLGACMAACFAARGHDVVGVDISQDVVTAVNSGRAPVREPGLPEAMERAGKRLRATTDVARAVSGSDATFIIVPTPSRADGTFALDYVLAAGQSVGDALRAHRRWHLVVLSSTVLPGSTERALLQVIEQASGKKVGDDFGLCYSPEFIAIGSVIRDFLNPDFALIGQNDARAGDALKAIYDATFENQAPVARMSIVNAEITKIALNTYVTTKISFANMLAELCEKMPGASVDVVTRALGLDSRIGPKYLKGSLGYGGPCFPRDNLAFGALLRWLDVDPSIPAAVDGANRRHAKRTAELALGNLAKDNRSVTVLGLSYKPGTHIVEGSQALEVARMLAPSCKVTVHDPAARPGAQDSLGDLVHYEDDAERAVRDAAVVIIATPWPEYKGIGRHLTGRQVLIDGWRHVDPAGLRCRYVALGVGAESPASALRVRALIDEITSPGLAAGLRRRAGP